MPDCPRWSDDAPEARTAAHESSAVAAYRLVWESAARRMLGREHPLEWHHQMFAEQVPLDYYAGNYRQDDSVRICLGVNVSVGGLAGAHFKVVLPQIQQLFSEARQHMANLEVLWPTITPQQRVIRLSQIIAI